MCGIVGVVGSLRSGVERGALEQMNGCLRHRGPDGEGFFWDADVGLAMRRLAIIDVAGSDQPIFNEDGSVCVVFNGEIYNFRDLRAELESMPPLRKAPSGTSAISRRRTASRNSSPKRSSASSSSRPTFWPKRTCQ